MPNPKRRHSKQRTRTRRATHDKTMAPTLAVCTSCGAPHLLHRVCGECGTYRGKKVFEPTVAA